MNLNAKTIVGIAAVFIKHFARFSKLCDIWTPPIVAPN